MSEAPKSAADARPNNRPAYIDPNCPNCGMPLILWDVLMRTPPEQVWHDEWWCRRCEQIVMDWPPGELADILGEEAVLAPGTREWAVEAEAIIARAVEIISRDPALAASPDVQQFLARVAARLSKERHEQR